MLELIDASSLCFSTTNRRLARKAGTAHSVCGAQLRSSHRPTGRATLSMCLRHTCRLSVCVFVANLLLDRPYKSQPAVSFSHPAKSRVVACINNQHLHFSAAFFRVSCTRVGGICALVRWCCSLVVPLKSSGCVLLCGVCPGCACAVKLLRNYFSDFFVYRTSVDSSCCYRCCVRRTTNIIPATEYRALVECFVFFCFLCLRFV